MIEKCFILTLVLMLSGCVSERNRTLSPPEDTQWVTVGVNVPEELMVLPLKVIYRSEICKRTRHNSSGEAYEVPGYNSMEFPLSQKDSTKNFYDVKLARQGGGRCQWHLSVADIRLQYKNPLQFGQGTESVESSIKLEFDYLAANQGGGYQRINSDGLISKDYFPYLTEDFIGGYEKNIWIYNGEMDERYSALNINSITFYPLLHSDKLVRSIGPKKKEKGVYRTLIYPDGTTIPITEAFPDIDVLKKFIK
ncbi:MULTISPECIES: hypothetical protein [Citrobacter]|mgnify:FL=1|uniref:Lipoprotein n=1 Tax=Citrobacter cronae TaxID=1748967 RepID=A0A7X1BR99_9ENTR|nr:MULTISPECIES: hypothetical protein [Citrobacter]MBC2620413.1 hypothetical protein [Citrobacter cronae]MDM3300510.1 hypothetical protein [Citrobacter sp. Cc227]